MGGSVKTTWAPLASVSGEDEGMAPLRHWPRGTTKVQQSFTVEAAGAVEATTCKPAAGGQPRRGGTAVLTSPVRLETVSGGCDLPMPHL